jgi:hypothetical protein
MGFYVFEIEVFYADLFNGVVQLVRDCFLEITERPILLVGVYELPVISASAIVTPSKEVSAL